MMNACPWTLPNSRGHREIDVYVRSCARWLVCVFVCMRVHICVCVSLSLFHFLSLTLFFVHLSLHSCLFLCFFFPFSLVFSLVFSLSESQYLCVSVCLCVCVAVLLCLCVPLSVRLCTHVCRYSSNSTHKFDETSGSTPLTVFHTLCACGRHLLRNNGRGCCIRGPH